MRFASIGSGSEGNGLLVEAGKTRILIDCGFGVRDTVARLARLGVTPESLTAILVTHEHNDHAGGVPAFAGKYDIPVWLTFGTIFEVGDRFDGIAQMFGFDSHDVFRIGDLEIHPFPVPHDAREPVQFVVSDGQHRLGLLTDIGGSTPFVQASLTGCSALVLECNHDLELLLKGSYPPTLKRRISGRYGHLDNATAARLLDKAGQALQLTVTLGERTDAASGQRWITADLTLAALAAGDYAVELTTTAGETTRQVITAFRVTR